MTELNAFKEFVERANTHNLMYDRRILNLVSDLGCEIEPYDLDSYIITSKDVKSKPMKLASVLRKLGIHSKAVDQKYMIISYDKTIADNNADALRKSMHDLKMLDRSSFDDLSETMKEFIDMANVKLVATELADQITELERLGYSVNKGKEGYQISIPKKAFILTIGDILSARARLESYANQMFPKQNLFMHFVVKYGLKSPTFSIGISLKDINGAISNATANF